MSEKLKPEDKPGNAEKLSRLGRNWNILGAVALGGLAAAIPGPNVVLGTLAGINAAQAGGFELFRRSAERKRREKNKADNQRKS